jgi:hypothetical protein
MSSAFSCGMHPERWFCPCHCQPPCPSFCAHTYGLGAPGVSGRYATMCVHNRGVTGNFWRALMYDSRFGLCRHTEVQGCVQEVLPPPVRVRGPASGPAAPRHGRNCCCRTLRMQKHAEQRLFVGSCVRARAACTLAYISFKQHSLALYVSVTTRTLRKKIASHSTPSPSLSLTLMSDLAPTVFLSAESVSTFSARGSSVCASAVLTRV